MVVERERLPLFSDCRGWRLLGFGVAVWVVLLVVNKLRVLSRGAGNRVVGL